MERAFQTSLWLFKPEVVFILGDVFDEGKWSSPEVSIQQNNTETLKTQQKSVVA